MTDIDNLKTTHPAYAQYAQQWDYLYRSYVGGDEYKTGAYLRKYLGEDDAPGNQYLQRLISTALDNQCKTVIDVYRSFLFRNEPERNFGVYNEYEPLDDIEEDFDLEKHDATQFMKILNDWLSVYGTMWVIVDKPAYQAVTAAEEEEMGIRPYAAMIAPVAVLDWKFELDAAGRRKLVYFKYVEDRQNTYDTIKIWQPDTVTKVVASKVLKPITAGNLTVYGQSAQREHVLTYDSIISEEVITNMLGYIPVVNCRATDSLIPGIGVSDINDVADIQRSIYNKLSELEQTIRVSNHPALVKTSETKAAAGAGAIITMTDDLDPGLKPFLLEPSGASIDGIIKAIELDVESIKRMTHLSAVQATRGSAMSGVALQTEFQLLNASLSERADQLEAIEREIWCYVFDWLLIEEPDDFEIEYPDSFDLRDQHNDLALYEKALTLVPVQSFQKAIYMKIARLVLGDECEEVIAEIENIGLDLPEVIASVTIAETQEAQEKLAALNRDIEEDADEPLEPEIP